MTLTNDRLIGRLQAMAKLDNLADEHYETLDQAIEALHRADIQRPGEPSAPMKAIPFESGVTYYVCMHQPPEHMRRTQCPLCDI